MRTTINQELPGSFSHLKRLILGSPYLRRLLLPEGEAISSYEILDYRATLYLRDTEGKRATFTREQVIRFLQNGVSGILDHAWGSGILVTNYWNSAGVLEDTFKEGDQRHLLIELRRQMARGETLKFAVERTAREAFRGPVGAMETTIDHPIKRLSRRIVFPKGRPVQQATLIGRGKLTELPVVKLGDGRTAVQVTISDPVAESPYVIRWIW